jgi:hypothetical protein
MESSPIPVIPSESLALSEVEWVEGSRGVCHSPHHGVESLASPATLQPRLRSEGSVGYSWTITSITNNNVHWASPESSDFFTDVISGFYSNPRTLSCKHLTMGEARRCCKKFVRLLKLMFAASGKGD